MIRLLGVLLLITAFMSSAHSQSKSAPITISFPDGTKVEAEPVFTNETRARGLMFRTYLPPTAGMLFLFGDLQMHGFWMKNTLIPLDLIWMNEKKEVVYFATADPCKEDPCSSYRPMQKALYVLEVNGGFAKKHQLKIGERLGFVIPPEIEQRIE